MENSQCQEVIDYIHANCGRCTTATLQEKFPKYKPGSIRNIIRRHNLRKCVPALDGYGRIAHEAERLGLDVNTVDHGWIKTEEASIHFRNDLPKRSVESIVEESMEKMKNHAPKYPPIKRQKQSDPHLFIIDLADVHFGKLALAAETGEDYNIEIARKRCLEGTKGLLQKAQSYNVEKFLLPVGNDILHFDTPRRATTSGTPQDTEGQLWSIWQEALNTYVEIIESLLSVADVEIVYNPSNHDYMSGYFLAQTLAAWFRLSKNVTFDVSIRHRKHTTYGNNLITTSHGDGAKHSDMPYLMAHEHPSWSNSQKQFRYIYLHHLHHSKRTKWNDLEDTQGVTLQILRSPSAPDGWHDRNGYNTAPRAVEGFLHHKEQGRVASFTHYF